MLWAGLHFPDWCLQALTRGVASASPLAVEDGAPRPAILACCRRARALGVKAGMGVFAALAAAPGLDVRARNPAAEAAALDRVLAWAGQFTPTVSAVPPDGVLLEIGGCLKLFGGLKELTRRIRAGVADLGLIGRVAVAPTPSGAWLLARAGVEAELEYAARLEAAVKRLPLEKLPCGPALVEMLAGFGLSTCGDVLALPRAGLARRAGQELLDFFDRVLGALPDPRVPYRPPERYSDELELAGPVVEAEPLLFATRRLLVGLAGFLAGRGIGVTRLALHLRHRDGVATRVGLDPAAPSRDAGHLLLLLREKVYALPLFAPVTAVRLEAVETAPLAPVSGALFAGENNAADGEAIAPFLDRLAARLGADSLTRVVSRPDHRPELAWAQAAPIPDARPLPSIPCGPSNPRPLWLLPEPRLLEGGDGPWLDGPLALLSEPERIESGWWDGADAARDYFVARNSQGELLWVFRERRRQQWFLHGIFA